MGIEGVWQARRPRASCFLPGCHDRVIAWGVIQAARLEAEQAEDVEDEEEGAGEGDDEAQAAELYCLCRQPDDPAAPRDFVACDKCEQWFHPECVDTTMEVCADTTPLLISALKCIFCSWPATSLGNGSTQSVSTAPRRSVQAPPHL